MSTVLAGWYADPQNPGQLRWWDGNAWTEHQQPRLEDTVEAGWYDDPNVPGARRFWDGAAWTEHAEGPPQQAAVAAGWYPDPNDANVQRYWDGAAWTEHVQGPAQVAPGWYPDPQNAQIQRYWDGAAWTDQTQVLPLFDAELHIGFWTNKKKERLVVTPLEMWWGDERIQWSEVTAFSQLVTVTNGFESQYEITLAHGEKSTRLVIIRKGRKDMLARQGYDVVIEQLRVNLGGRVLTGLLQMVDNGEPVRISGLLLSPAGFCHEEKGQAIQPWSEYAGMQVGGHEGIYVSLFRNVDGKKKMVTRVSVDMMRAWVIPPVVEAHARRYAPA